MILSLAKQSSILGKICFLQVNVSTRGNATILRSLGVMLNQRTYAFTIKMVSPKIFIACDYDTQYSVTLFMICIHRTPGILLELRFCPS